MSSISLFWYMYFKLCKCENDKNTLSLPLGYFVMCNLVPNIVEWKMTLCSELGHFDKCTLIGEKGRMINIFYFVN